MSAKQGMSSKHCDISQSDRKVSNAGFCWPQVGKAEADAAVAEQRALDLQQQLQAATEQLDIVSQEQTSSASDLQQSHWDLQAQLEQMTSKAQAAEVRSKLDSLQRLPISSCLLRSHWVDRLTWTEGALGWMTQCPTSSVNIHTVCAAVTKAM